MIFVSTSLLVTVSQRGWNLGESLMGALVSSSGSLGTQAIFLLAPMLTMKNECWIVGLTQKNTPKAYFHLTGS
jgi:hypothetical protein